MSAAAVRVVIPVHNGERYLGEAIESVLGQAGINPEVIVVDDGSTDGSAAVARSFGARVRCRRIAHAGIGHARNAGMEACRSEFVAFLDADDLWTPTALAELLDALTDPSCELAFGHVVQFLSPELDDAAGELGWYHGETLEPGYTVGAGLMRREAFTTVGPFRGDVVSGEFIDWIARARELGIRERLIPAHVLRRRIHVANHGRRQPEGRSDYARVLKEALDRRRSVDAGGASPAVGSTPAE